MARPYDQFGGWLRVFYVCVVIWVVLALATGILLGYLALADEAEAVAKRLEAAAIAVVVVLAGYGVYVLRLMKSREVNVPSRIAVFVLTAAGLSVLLRVIVYFLGGAGISAPSLGREAIGVISGLVQAAAWVEYFRCSERVGVYYGANAFSGS